MRVPASGVIFIEVFVPHGVSELLLEAYDVGYSPFGLMEPYETTNASKTRMTVLRMQSVRDHVLQVTTTTRNAKVGEYIILHVKASYFIQNLNWIVTSKGWLLGVYLSLCLPGCPPACLPACLPTYLSVCLSACFCDFLFVYVSIWQSL